jgi:hypothetical protein
VAETDEPAAGYAITDSKFEMLRKIPIKTVCLVRQGSLCVVLCCVSLLFPLSLCVCAYVCVRVVGAPERMILNDHIANITDLKLFCSR